MWHFTAVVINCSFNQTTFYISGFNLQQCVFSFISIFYFKKKEVKERHPVFKCLTVFMSNSEQSRSIARKLYYVSIYVTYFSGSIQDPASVVHEPSKPLTILQLLGLTLTNALMVISKHLSPIGTTMSLFFFKHMLNPCNICKYKALKSFTGTKRAGLKSDVQCGETGSLHLT